MGIFEFWFAIFDWPAEETAQDDDGPERPDVEGEDEDGYLPEGV